MDNPVDLFAIFAEDKKMVAYRPQWRQITGSVTATILLQQILFHWDKSGRRPFYKFKIPCLNEQGAITNSMYKTGDSWIEELGFSRHEFNTAIKKIGCKISKRRLEKNPDLKTHDKPVEYYTDENHTTWYSIHEKNLAKLLAKLYEFAERPCENGECPLNPENGFSKSDNPDSGESGFRR